MDTDTLILVIVIGACIGLPLILAVWALRKFRGTSGSIKGGLPAQATIVSLAETGMTESSYANGPNAPVYKIGLQVIPPGGGAPYRTVCTHLVPRIYVPTVLPGATIGVLVDPTNPQHVVPDWSRGNCVSQCAPNATSTSLTINGKKVDSSSATGLAGGIVQAMFQNMGNPQGMQEVLRQRLAENDLAQEGADDAGDVAGRLEKIEKLRESGLLSEAEYTEQRRRILDSI